MGRTEGSYPHPRPSPQVEGPSQPLGACICSPGTPKPHGGKQGQADKWSPFLPPKSPSQGSWHSSWSAASQPGPGSRTSGHPRSRQVTGPGNKPGSGISEPALRVKAKELNRSFPTPSPPQPRPIQQLPGSLIQPTQPAVTAPRACLVPSATPGAAASCLRLPAAARPLPDRELEKTAILYRSLEASWLRGSRWRS